MDRSLKGLPKSWARGHKSHFEQNTQECISSDKASWRFSYNDYVKLTMKYKKKEVFHYETQPKSLDRNHLDVQWVFGTFVKAETEFFFLCDCQEISFLPPHEKPQLLSSP